MQSYCGRFAPSPSGDLHFGSLIAAIGSYLDARSQQGRWLVRIEDIDPPREVPGATKSILNTLEHFGLEWDDSVIYQSQRHDFYQHHLDVIRNNKDAYPCDCTRKAIMQDGGLYKGRCRSKPQVGSPHSIRFDNQDGINHFNDRLQGLTQVDNDFANEDFILKRKDGLFAYQLVVVLDDIDQKITDIVRGCDLLEVTTRQMTLCRYLGAQHGRYMHLPLVVNSQGLKLSKQNHAKALDPNKTKQLLIAALAFLGQQFHKDYQDYNLEQLLKVAVENWQIADIPAVRSASRQINTN